MYHFSNYSSFQNILAAISISVLGAVSPAVAQETATETVVELPSEQRFSDTLQGIFADGGKSMADFASFYAARDNQPIWADGNSASILALITAIEQAPNHGMALGRYNLPELEALWMAGNTPEDLATLEAAAAQSYVKFAKEISSGILDPKSIHREMNATRFVPETADVLADVAGAENMPAHYKALAPSSAEYAQLMDLKKELEALISSEGWGPLVPTGRTLRPGNTDDRVPALRVRLNQRGYALDDLSLRTYDDALVEAVKLFQTDFGLNADGLVGPQTLSSINAQPDGRLKQVIVNLERIRWMNYDLGDRHIYVNVPDFTASVMDFGVPTLSFRVVVGTGKNQTAEFSDSMTHMIANPKWNVPYSIASQEYLPKLRADPTILARENIQMSVSGTGQIVDPSMIDFSYFDKNNFPFFLQQQSGRGNALGRVKFMFPNRFNIYLHDTPSKSLFSRDARAFSHGCIRVQNPFEFAYTLLSLQEDDPEAAFKRALNTGRETQINLVKPVPVHIVYRTVWIDQAGEAQFRHDIYNRDAMVFDALTNAGVTLPALQG